MGRKGYQALAISALLLAGCVKDKPGNINTNPSDRAGVYIACEGQYTAGNATLYLYNPAKDSTYGDLYQAANNRQLGDVLQSITAIDSRLFLAVNNSNKVVVVNAADTREIASINVPYPRYIVATSNHEAYVSSLYRNKVYIINTNTYTLTDSVTLPHTNTEGMLLQGGNLYVCAWDTTCNQLYKIDAATHQLKDSIALPGYAPHKVLADRDGLLWVLSGNREKRRNAWLTRIDPSTGAVLKSLQFPDAAEPIKPILNTTKDTIYFIEANYYGGTTNNGVYRMAITAASLPVEPFVAAVQYQYYWALGIDPATGHIYVGDPKGFNQKGSVAVYNTNGTKVDSFTTGVGPGSFLFP